jgi:DNA-binding transcriptional LysR family regulator
MALLDNLAVFLASVEEGGFAAAGRKVNRSRSAVGKCIARLEGEVGARLFHRSSRTNTLTSEGELLYEQAKRTLAELDALTSALDARRRSPTGILRVTAPSALGRLVAKPLVQLAADHPDLKIQMRFTDEVLGLLEEGMDLGVRVGPLADSATLRTRRIASMTMHLCASPEYRARCGAPRTLAELRDHDAIIYGRGPFRIAWQLSDATGRRLEVVPRERVRFDDLDAMCDAAAAGLGVAWLPAWLIAEPLRTGRLETLLPDVYSEPFAVHAIWPAMSALPARLRMAIDALAERLPSLLAGQAATETRREKRS